MSRRRFFVSPQPPKPSMLSLVTGSWRPNSEDTARHLEAGLGATTMAINGAIGGQSSSCCRTVVPTLRVRPQPG